MLGHSSAGCGAYPAHSSVCTSGLDARLLRRSAPSCLSVHRSAAPLQLSACPTHCRFTTLSLGLSGAGPLKYYCSASEGQEFGLCSSSAQVLDCSVVLWPRKSASPRLHRLGTRLSWLSVAPVSAIAALSLFFRLLTLVLGMIIARALRRSELGTLHSATYNLHSAMTVLGHGTARPVYRYDA